MTEHLLLVWKGCQKSRMKLKLGHATGSVPKHSRKSATECLKKCKNKGVAMIQSPALILIEVLWQLKELRVPTNVN